MQTSSKKSVIPVFAIFLLMLLAWFTYSLMGFTRALQTKSWPTTTGIVNSAEVKKVASKGSSQYAPIIAYSFQIDNEEYTSEKYSSTTARGASQWAKDIVDQYPANSEVNVFYNPENPKQSVLVPGLQSDNYWMTILSLVFSVVVSLAFVKQLKKE